MVDIKSSQAKKSTIPLDYDFQNMRFEQSITAALLPGGTTHSLLINV